MISVIIPAHDEERYLATTLEALSRQTYPFFEVLVVANGCSDNTERVAEGKCDRLLHLAEKGLSRARNLGGKKARGDLLVFLDADTLLAPDGLATIAREFNRACAMGTLKGKPDTPKLGYQIIYFVKNFQHRSHLHFGSSGIIICWKDYFKRTGGFDEALHVCEIGDFMRRMRKCGPYKYIAATSVTTSMRRYEQRGILPMIWHWLRVWFASLFSDLRHRSYEPVR